MLNNFKLGYALENAFFETCDGNIIRAKPNTKLFDGIRYDKNKKILIQVKLCVSYKFKEKFHIRPTIASIKDKICTSKYLSYEKIVLDDKPIIEYINNENNNLNSKEKYDEEEDIKSQSSSMNSSESIKKYKIKNGENEVDINSIKIKKMNVEDKLLQLLDDDPMDYKISLQKKIDYQLRLTTAMNNISPTKNIIFIVTELMKFIDNFELKGEDKKQLIISSIQSFLITENVNESTINFIVNTVCPELIDILISVDKRSITIKKKISCFFPWCS